MGRMAKAAPARNQPGDMDGERRSQRIQLIHDLELKHQKNTHDTDILVKDEDVRRLRVRILLLRDENAALQDQVDLNDSANTKLASRCDSLNAELEAKVDMVRSQEEELRKQEREYISLRAELQSMSSVNDNSASVLAEKLSLTRELANLKPEIEHLRSQVDQQQAILTEKLSLERQVNTLEVELANEKKAIRRAMQSRESNDRVEDDLRKKLRETEKSLTAETAERERLQDQLEQQKRTHETALQDQDTTRGGLEADLRKKLQEAQRQLREEKEEKERLDEELQTAQRASKKSQQASARNSAEEDELRAQLEEAQKSAAMLQAKTDKRCQEYETAIAELEARNEQLAKKLEKGRTKYRDMQEELKKTQGDLRKAQQQQQTRPSSRDEFANPGSKAQAHRKRKAPETSMGDFTNIEINTPSAEDGKKARRAVKKAAFEPTVVEKSTFSITPFLNRNKNASMSEEASNMEDDEVLEDSILGPQSASQISEPEPSRTDEPSNVTDSTEPAPAATAPSETENPQVAPKTRGRPKKILGDAPSARKNALTQKAPKKILKTKSSLEKVPEAAEPEQQDNHDESGEAEPAEKTATVKFSLAPSHAESNESNPTVEVPKKKKRKVLGSNKTLFDEDDGEEQAANKPVKTQLGAKRSKAPLGIQKLNAFAGTATFSPLKRDRRGVGASFLA
ncbi:hypothetical protein F4808DRAFT_405045 [Astrocystis sublimbata]|nr:hypothetical protein F4808DRAFT_405045 [Astrocystis sublimbata]